jgi:WD40 repeat protein
MTTLSEYDTVRFAVPAAYARLCIAKLSWSAAASRLPFDLLQSIAEAIVVTEGHLGPFQKPAHASCLAASPDGKLLASAGGDGCLQLWCTITSRSCGVLPHPVSIKHLDFAACSNLLLSCSESTTRVWNVVTLQIERIFENDAELTSAWFISGDGRGKSAAPGVATIDERAKIQFYELKTGKHLHTLRHDNNYIAYGTVTPRWPHVVATSDWENKVNLHWQEGIQEKRFVLRAHATYVTYICFAPNGRWLLSASFDGDVVISEFTSEDFTTTLFEGGPIKRLLGHRRCIVSAAFSEDSQTVASCSLDCTVRLWDAPDWLCFRCIRHPGSVVDVSFHPSNERIFTCCEDGQIRAWQFARSQSEWLAQQRRELQLKRLKKSVTDLELLIQRKDKQLRE